MTMSASFQRAIAPFPGPSPRKAREAVQAAADRLQEALAALHRADDEESARRIKDRAADDAAAAVMNKAAARRTQNTRDADRAWLSVMAKRLRQLSSDVAEPNVAELRIASRMRELAEEAERVLRSLS